MGPSCLLAHTDVALLAFLPSLLISPSLSTFFEITSQINLLAFKSLFQGLLWEELIPRQVSEMSCKFGCRVVSVKSFHQLFRSFHNPKETKNLYLTPFPRVRESHLLLTSRHPDMESFLCAPHCMLRSISQLNVYFRCRPVPARTRMMT